MLREELELSLLKKLDGPRLRLRRSSSGIITVKATLLAEWLFALGFEADVVVGVTVFFDWY